MVNISVVVCAKNEEKYIGACLKALKNQIVKPEIIVIDGHSTDKTVKIAKKYADKVIRDNKKGVGSARNMGWKAASGDIIAYCDTDSTPPKDWTKKIVENIKGYVAISGPLIAPGAREDIQMQLSFWSNLVFRVANKFNQPIICGPNMAFPKKILKKYPFKVNVLEDVEIAHRLGKVGKVKYMESLKMPIVPRRYEKHLLETILKHYARNYIRLKILRKMPTDWDYFKN